jgi:hypothetical protein
LFLWGILFIVWEGLLFGCFGGFFVVVVVFAVLRLELGAFALNHSTSLIFFFF